MRFSQAPSPARGFFLRGAEGCVCGKRDGNKNPRVRRGRRVGWGVVCVCESGPRKIALALLLELLESLFDAVDPFGTCKDGFAQLNPGLLGL